MTHTRLRILPEEMGRTEAEIQMLRQQPERHQTREEIEARQDALDRARLAIESPDLYNAGSIFAQTDRAIMEAAMRYLQKED